MKAAQSGNDSMIRIIESDEDLEKQREQYLELLQASRSEDSAAGDVNVDGAVAPVVVGVTGPAQVGTTGNSANVAITGPTGTTH